MISFGEVGGNPPIRSARPRASLCALPATCRSRVLTLVIAIVVPAAPYPPAPYPYIYPHCPLALRDITENIDKPLKLTGQTYIYLYVRFFKIGKTGKGVRWDGVDRPRSLHE